MNVEKIILSDHEKNILKMMAKLADKGYSEVGHEDLARLLKDENPQVFNYYVRTVVKKGLLRYMGKRKGQYMYSIKKKGYLLAQSLDHPPTQKKLVVKEKTKHLGITTTEKETVVSPVPSRLETQSASSLGASAGTSSSSVSASYSQTDKKKLDFEKKNNDGL